jgi:mannose-6-phosphate isomerase
VLSILAELAHNQNAQLRVTISPAGRREDGTNVTTQTTREPRSRNMARVDWVTPARHVPKPWGYEEHFALVPGRYCGKILHISAGHALSLQLHEAKDETIAVYTGSIELEIGRTQADLDHIELHPGDTVHIPPGTVHRMTALEDAIVMEASTTELDDVIRLEDRYGRVNCPDVYLPASVS